MIVAVTMRLANADRYTETRDAVSHDWTVYLDRLGITPVFVPNVLKGPEEYLTAVGARALLLTGGDDIGPLNGEAGGPSPSHRDETETRLLARAVTTKLPVLGICRGLQVINVHFGGGLTRDLAAQTGESHAACTHPIRLAGDGCSVHVNSFHNQGVVLKNLGEPLRMLATSPHGVVEALEHRELNIRAVMWHPERNNSATELDGAIFRKWLGQTG